MKQITLPLYLQVLLGIMLGAMTGLFLPDLGVKLKVLGDIFIALIRMLIGPVIFCTVVLGMLQGGSDIRGIGRIGARAILYFEVVSTLALILGLMVMHYLQPGHGFDVDLQSLKPHAVDEYVTTAGHRTLTDFIMHIVPGTFLDAFTADGNLLQILLLAVLFGVALLQIGESGKPVHLFLESASRVFYTMLAMLMKLAPLGAGGAMAFTLGKYGADALAPLMALMGSFYLTCVLFVGLVLGAIAAWVGFSIIQLIRYLSTELLTVLGTSSSESALAPLMEKLENLGCSRQVVGIVVPAGYSFNLDGTNIYLTMATMFIAQALNIDLTLVQEMEILAVAMLTSKGAAGFTGSGFITLAATLSSVPGIPVEGMVLIIGIDRFMSEARSLTNFMGNAVATIVIAHWENALDRHCMYQCLRQKPQKH